MLYTKYALTWANYATKDAKKYFNLSEDHLPKAFCKATLASLVLPYITFRASLAVALSSYQHPKDWNVVKFIILQNKDYIKWGGFFQASIIVSLAGAILIKTPGLKILVATASLGCAYVALMKVNHALIMEITTPSKSRTK